MEYIKLFDTHSDYEEFAGGGMLRPNVSHCVSENEVHYNPWTWANEYLTITPHGDGNVVINMYSGVTTDVLSSISYSKDNGETWVTTNNVNGTNVTVTIEAINGEDILLKGEGTSMAKGGDLSNGKPICATTFSTNFEFILKGNIMSLLKGDEFKNDSEITGSTDTFIYLFSGCTNLIDAENLVLPAATLANKCYHGMFKSCTSLTTAPELPAITLAESCYRYMFDGCTNLVNIPSILPATTLTKNCYYGMFEECTSLTTAPELPATVLADWCYAYMFEDCTSLTTAPKLPATTLAEWCYRSMFNGCTGLTVAPELPATTLASKCYDSMFSGCTSLAIAPELPATTLVERCYYQMFQNCANLNSITCLATDISATNCTNNWVMGVAAIGTFTKAASMTSWTTGVSGIPEGWTEQNA